MGGGAPSNKKSGALHRQRPALFWIVLDARPFPLDGLVAFAKGSTMSVWRIQRGFGRLGGGFAEDIVNKTVHFDAVRFCILSDALFVVFHERLFEEDLFCKELA